MQHHLRSPAFQLPRARAPPQLTRCHGFKLQVAEPVVMNYPDARHVNPMKWTRPDDNGIVFAPRFAQGERACSVFLLVDDMNVDAPKSCVACNRLASEPSLSKLVENANSETYHTTRIRHEYLTRNQLAQRLGGHRST